MRVSLTTTLLALMGACGPAPSGSVAEPTGDASSGGTGSATGAPTSTAGDAGDTTGGDASSADLSPQPDAGDGPCPRKVYVGDFVGHPLDLAGYTEVTGLLIIEETDAVDLTGLECLERVEVGLAIRYNAALRSTQGLERLEYVGSLNVGNNPELLDVLGFQSLVTVDGPVRIRFNSKLTSLAGLEALTTITESIDIQENALEDLQGLSGLETVGSRLQLRGEPGVTHLHGLSALASVGDLEVWQMNSLLTLDGLENLLSLKYGLGLWDNALLADVSALANARMEALDGTIDVYENPALPACDVAALVAAISPAGFMGMVDVHDNLGTCP